MKNRGLDVAIRNTTTEDFEGIIELTRAVYPESNPWRVEQLASHLTVFPEGQCVAVEPNSGRIVGMSSSLIISWDDYDLDASWRDFTDHGMFTNHDPTVGRTLYGAEVMAHPDFQGRGIGKKLYRRRRELAEALGLLRIRAGARLRGYHRHAKELSAEEYAIQVIRGELGDSTLSFQLKQGYDVLSVVSGYLRNDPESLGYAAVIERLNEKIARTEDSAGRNPKFMRR